VTDPRITTIREALPSRYIALPDLAHEALPGDSALAVILHLECAGVVVRADAANADNPGFGPTALEA
jgi:hypothetical protein